MSLSHKRDTVCTHDHQSVLSSVQPAVYNVRTFECRDGDGSQDRVRTTESRLVGIQLPSWG